MAEKIEKHAQSHFETTEGEYFDDDDAGPLVTLREGIDISELSNPNGEGAIFEVDVDAQPDFDPNDYDQQEVYKHLSADALGDGSDSESDAQLGPFERMARRMKNVTEDGIVKKEVLKQGVGTKIPTQGYCTIHYNAYLEYADEPYDSTRLRNRALEFNMGKGDVIPGLDAAVGTMKKNELARILVGPKYAFGKYGCPPRIPPNATLMFEVELLGMCDAGGVEDFERMSASEKREAPFTLIKKVAIKEREEAKLRFQEERYQRAIRNYSKAIRVLENCHLADEHEEKTQQNLLLKLCTNIAVCHLKENETGKVITFANQALQINHTHVKALYLKGKALRQKGEYERSKTCLLKAQKFDPSEKDIAKELERLNRDLQKSKQMEKALCQNMFSSMRIDKTVPDEEETHDENKSSAIPLSAVTDEFVNIVKEELQSFKDDNEKSEMPFPSATFSNAEINAIKNTCNDLGMDIIEVGEGSNKHLRIKKKKPSEKDSSTE